MDTGGWLQSLGLERYEQAFRDNEIDVQVLPNLTGEDLKELGVSTVGHRRRLLDAIAALRTGTPSTHEAAVTTLPAGPESEHTGAAPNAERRQLTVMFCDLVGSTALASRLDPEDLREVLGAYHAAVAEVVTRFGGYVAKYMGDGVLAYFSYPQAHEHDAEQAVRAGLTLVDRVSQLASSAGPLASRVGIATGLVVVGDLIGSGESQERGVVGETPNLAARLQEMAPANAVLIADSTRRLVGDLFNYYDLGAVTVKGLAEPVPASQVLSESAVENRFAALRSASLSPLIGRDGEVELLLRRWARAKDGEGQIVLISGEAGIGKSRIVTELHELLETDRAIRLRYFCSPHHRDSALYPFIVRFEHAVRLSRAGDASGKLDTLASLLSQSGDSAPETVAIFADLLGLSIEGRYPAPPSDPRQKRELTLAALVGQLEGLARHRPVLFVFEDAHWTDSTSLELLERAAERVRRLPVLMVVTYRPEFEAPWIGAAQVTALTLSRLGQRDAITLVERLAGGKTLPAEILNRVIERTDGIPLFIEELMTTLLAGGLLREEDGHYDFAGPALRIPSSLHDSLMARLDQLAPVKEVAQIGATIGREFSYEVLAAVAGQPDEHLRGALDQLVAAGLIIRRGARPQASFVFKHALVQDTAYGTLLRGRRQELHATIARVLEERSAQQGVSVREHAAVLAHHWLRAEEWERALSHSLAAAERAQELYARPEAISHYWQALELLERLPPTNERSQVHIDIILSLIQMPGGMRNEAGKADMLRHLDQALTDATAGKQLATASRLQALKGQHWRDETLLLEAIASAERSGDRLTQAFVADRYGVHLEDTAGSLRRWTTSLEGSTLRVPRGSASSKA